jgi:uncharacterized protein (DUF2147 family)
VLAMPNLENCRMKACFLALAWTACLIFGLQAPSARAADVSAAGLWAQVEENGKIGGWFLISDRNGVYEGTIVKMFIEPGDDPNPVCTKCTGEEKNQPSLGLTIIKGMKRKGMDYENGTILDPRDGSVYSAQMRVSPDGQSLTVRGYLGISLLGRSQTWRRLPDSAYAEIDRALLARLQPQPQRQIPQAPQAQQRTPAQPAPPPRPRAPGAPAQ